MNKKLTVKRVIIFCIISFLPFWIVVPVLNSCYGGMVYTVEEAAVAVYVLGVLGMFIPAIANLLTRLITKEGFGNSYLGLNLKGNGKYYAAAILVKPMEAALAMLLICKVLIKDIAFGELFVREDFSPMLAVAFMQIAAAVIIFFPAFGEEWGWRGYLGPKLKELLGMPASIIVGGVIWGLWHAPLTIAGHNFGTDYAFYPWLGIGSMCVMCILFNAFLTWLTERTNSIYPASFCHMINNSLQVEFFIAMFVSERGQEALNGNPDYHVISVFLLYLPVLAITGIVAFVALIKKKREVQ